ncbi:ABC transporter substrate-binding protein [Streptomyces sp. VRA16 Mangrove soil]|uniref:ABC transporter substrate-binding protein n=1 Tax=Streptomyces sp. VRA16 Mangrove soil TaxID=2817434 RepID=UPI001A9D7AC9|nr:ABC transporter substrate-binding protein [Streptomyces sp. VRA16 Mangrove soil]MBO1337443.1 ABC transporter substrate-binding protein [Streptomyces sp. VRA16 Mangrove soil]
MRRRGLLLAAAGIGLTSACGSFTGTARGGRLGVDLAFAPTQGLSPYGDDGLLLSRLAVVDGLTRMDTDGVIHPALAEKWTRTNATTWEFTLRAARFQDGGDVTADAVVRALREAGRAEVTPRVLSDVRLRAEAVGERRVRIATGTADPLLPARLANPSLAVLSPAAYGKDGRVDPVGTATGPFALTQVHGAVSAALDRFDGHWRGKAAARGLDVTFVADNNARANALRSGQIEVAEFVPAAQALLLGDRARKVGTVRTTTLYLNTGKGPLADAGLRAAVREAIDTSALASSVYEGYARQATGLLGPGFAWADGKQLPVTGRARATRPRGRTLTLATYTNRAELPEVAAALQQQLEKAGFGVRLVVKDYARLEAGALDGAYDAFLMSRSTALDTGDPVSYLASDFTGGGSFNISRLDDPDVDAAVRAAAGREGDARHRAVLVAEAAILRTDAAVPIVHEEHLQGVGAGVRGVVLDPYERQFIGLETRA